MWEYFITTHQLMCYYIFCKNIYYIGFWSIYINQQLTQVGTILLCYIYVYIENVCILTNNFPKVIKCRKLT